jgi:signal peptidase I
VVLGSMEDTVLPGDHVLVNKLVVPRRLLVQFPFVPLSPVTLVIPAVRSLRLGDVLVVRPPALVAQRLLPRDAYILKRCVGLPGDTLRFEGFLLRVNGRVVSLPPTAKQARDPRLVTETGTPYTIIVPQGSYFMMGDNPGRSEDSRVWGPVPNDAIVGSAAIVYWSVAPAAPGIDPEGGHASVRWDRIGVLIR